MSAESIVSWARKQPEANAVIHNGVAVSYAEFSGAIETTRRYLETQALPEAQTAIVIVENLLDSWTVVFALQALGLTTVCAKSIEFAQTLGIKGAPIVVSTVRDLSQQAAGVKSHPQTRIIQVPNPSYTPSNPGGTPAFRQGGHILYTSGTTGNYKKLFLSGHLQSLRDKEIAKRNLYSPGKMYHGINFGLWTAAGYKVPQSVWDAGACVILDQRSDWPRFFKGAGNTRSVMIPDMVEQFLSSLDESPAPSPLMEFGLVVGAGFISHKSAERILTRLTKNLENQYGSTEINLGMLNSKVTNLEDLHWLAPTGDRIVEIVDESGVICPTGKEGMLRIRLTELDCSCYMDDPEATRKAFRDGCFYPGDMAVERADGRIRILGRSTDVMNLKGQKIAVAPMEHKIQAILGVSAVCLFSGLNDAGEEEVIIALESQQPPEKSALMNLGHEFAQFEQVRFAHLQRFPRTSTGTSKIDRIALRKLIFAVPN